MWGIWLDLASDQKDEAVYEKAKGFVKQSRLTDAELVYTPSQIALAAFSLADPVLAKSWESLQVKPLDEDVLEAIRSMIVNEGRSPPVEAVREIDKRLKLCKNPEKVVGSRAYEKRKAEEDNLAGEKRRKKADAARQSMEDNNPFGEPLGDPSLDDDD